MFGWLYDYLIAKAEINVFFEKHSHSPFFGATPFEKKWKKCQQYIIPSNWTFLWILEYCATSTGLQSWVKKKFQTILISVFEVFVQPLVHNILDYCTIFPKNFKKNVHEAQ